MEIVEIEFNQWSMRKLYKNLKCSTTRRTKKGNVGDKFMIELPDGIHWYCLTMVEKVKLSVVYHYYFRHEGCATKQEFKEIWTKIHPKRGLDMNWKVWLHVFEEII